MIDLVPAILGFLATYGLVAVFVLLVLDGAMLMPALPGEIVMIMAVATFAETWYDLAFLIALATVAAMLGSLLLYAVCRKGGRRLIDKYPKLFMMNPRRREKMERVFAHPAGQSLVLFLRVIPLTRVLVNIPAGLAKMKLGRFMVLSFIGLLVFHVGFMYATFVYGDVGSERAASIKAAYANPAWDYVRTNQIVAALGALAIGAILSIRATRSMMRDPQWAGPSVLGWLAERIVFFGGLAILVMLWFDRNLIFVLAEHGGLDLAAVAEHVNWEPVSFIVVVTVGAMTIALTLMLLANRARVHRNRSRREAEFPVERAEVVMKSEGKRHPKKRRGRSQLDRH